MPREVNEHFELLMQSHTPILSSTTDILPVSNENPSTPAKVQIPKDPPQPTTPVKCKSPVKPNVGTEKASYQQEVLLPDLEELLKFLLNSKTKDFKMFKMKCLS